MTVRIRFAELDGFVEAGWVGSGAAAGGE